MTYNELMDLPVYEYAEITKLKRQELEQQVQQMKELQEKRKSMMK